MGSRESLIPMFQKQIEENKPLTLTVPHMTRFLMTLDQSVNLVLYAMTHAQGGEVFVRKAPASTIQDLAHAMRLTFSPLRQRHPLDVVGIRPGEKIHEVLVNEHEMQRASEPGDYFTIYPEYRRPPQTFHKRNVGEEHTSGNTQELNGLEEIQQLLKKMGEVELDT